MRRNSDYTSDELFLQIADGDENAFRKVFHSFNQRLFPYVLNIVKSSTVAEEIVQEVFLKLWTNRQAVAAMDNPVAWLFTVAANQSFTYLKRISTEQRVIDKIKQSMHASENPTDEYIFFNESKTILQKAVGELPAQRQVIYKLSREEGLNHQQIADQLNLSPNTVKNQLVSALRTIREQLQKTAGVFFFLLLFLLLLIYP